MKTVKKFMGFILPVVIILGLLQIMSTFKRSEVLSAEEKEVIDGFENLSENLDTTLNYTKVTGNNVRVFNSYGEVVFQTSLSDWNKKLVSYQKKFNLETLEKDG
ncbi:CapE family protein [Fictibacillus nanhaiensis]|uniref:CapE family protein n=1 Tax=Fictibacillus nanhaiensis TaxID=742169 RepID=UPI002E204816|nr:CapE family protein [Fictibacillus nanhaiensis]